MFFSFYKIIILNNEIEKGEKEDDDYINKKNVDFKRSYDFKMIFIKVCSLKVYNLFLSLNKSRFLRSSRRINDLNF